MHVYGYCKINVKWAMVVITNYNYSVYIERLSLRQVRRTRKLLCSCITLCRLVSVLTTVQVRRKPKAIPSIRLRNTRNASIKVIPQFCIAHFYCAHLITYNFIHYTYRLKQNIILWQFYVTSKHLWLHLCKELRY
jgi:hypothetical protein